MRRVAVTGMAGISPIGNDWSSVERRLRDGRNAVRHMQEWETYTGLLTHLGAPAEPIDLPPERYTRKATRSMGRVAMLSCRASEMALEDAGLLDDPILHSGKVGVAFGSSAGSTNAVREFGGMLEHKTTAGLNATSYLRMMGHTAPVNVAVFFGVTGRLIPTSSACTSGSQGIGYAFEAIRHGRATAMIAGGAEELCPTEAAVFDTLFATSTRNDDPQSTPRPFDESRDGLVLGEGAGAFVLEELDHARARGAHIYAEVVGFGTNCDGRHVTQPSAGTMAQAMILALDDAALPATAVGYINAHGTATQQGDVAESIATSDVFGNNIAISSLKSYMGHTLGACGALEAWMTIEMMRSGWFAPTINLEQVDPECRPLDYLTGNGRQIDTEFVASNNFAFGGVNTSLIFRRLG